jgi:hypothetical protein
MATSSSEHIDPDVEKGPKQESLVEWDGPGDPNNPHNWTPRFKWFVSAVLVTLPLIVNIGSSVMSGTLRSLEAEFHIGPEVAVLSTTTMFLIVRRNSHLPSHI